MQHSHLSVTDANITWFSENSNIKEVMSFDEGFYNVQAIFKIY
jgi:predicted nucleic acid-binding protein